MFRAAKNTGPNFITSVFSVMSQHKRNMLLARALKGITEKHVFRLKNSAISTLL
jgi:hypothetical protein